MTFKMKNVKLLCDQAIKEVTPENWRKAVQYVIKPEAKMWDLDNLIDPLIIISRGDDSSSDDEEYNPIYLFNLANLSMKETV